MFFKKMIFLFTLCFMFSSFIISQAEAAWNVWVDHSIKKYRQNGEDGISGSQSHSFKMARNEFESFQVFIYANGETLNSVDVSVSNFTKGSDTINDIYIYKEHYVNCSHKSRPEYETGYYPDALLPKVDRFYHETRNTFPFNVSSGKVQGIWIDVGTETATVPGTYNATVTVSADGKTDVQLPITLEVFDFALPSTASFPAVYIMRLDQQMYAHGLGYNFTTPEGIELMHTYQTFHLYHRTVLRSLGDGYSYPVDWDSGAKKLTITSWEPWRFFWEDALNGTAITNGPYAGAKPSISISAVPNRTEADSRIAPSDKATARQQYLQQIYDYYNSNGWDPYNKLYNNSLTDEPRCDSIITFRGQDVDECTAVKIQAQDVNAVNTHGAGTWKKVFAHTHNQRVGIKDFYDYGFYSPNSYAFACNNWDKTCQQGGPTAPRNQYPNYPNDEIWPYLACDNNGCIDGSDSDVNGQIDMSTDAQAMYNRLISFYMWKYQSAGTFFWASNNLALKDPYFDPWDFGSNGSGDLFFAGITTRTGRSWGDGGGEHTPSIGGTHDIPIASIRWKYIRDWLEDIEYMRIAEAAKGKAAVDAIVDTMFTNNNIYEAYWNLNMNPLDLFSAKKNLAQLIIETSDQLTITISKPTVK